MYPEVEKIVYRPSWRVEFFVGRLRKSFSTATPVIANYVRKLAITCFHDGLVLTDCPMGFS
jgi:hypothetical protein